MLRLDLPAVAAGTSPTVGWPLALAFIRIPLIAVAALATLALLAAFGNRRCSRRGRCSRRCTCSRSTSSACYWSPGCCTVTDGESAT